MALHEHMVFNLAARLLGDPEEARDVSQEVFLQVYRTLGRFEGRSSLKTWIYRIVVNQCHNRRRFWRRRARERSRPIEDLTAIEEAKLSQTGPSPSAFDRVRRAERAARVQEALMSLSFAHRAVLMLRDAEGLSCEAVAETLGLARGHGEEPARACARGSADPPPAVLPRRRRVMTCTSVRRRLSAYLESDLTAVESRVVATHLQECARCAEHHGSLRRTLELVGEMPRLVSRESLAARVLDRIEMERRGPGLAVFRTFLAARPLILPSLIPATFVLLTVLSGVLLLDGGRQPYFSFTAPGFDAKGADSGTESNPLFPSAEVSLPQLRGSRALGGAMGDGGGEGTFFLETVIARDGTVSAVTLLDGDSLQARPIVDALRRERFEPVRLHGRRVAVSVYRLISRLEVRAPLT